VHNSNIKSNSWFRLRRYSETGKNLEVCLWTSAYLDQWKSEPGGVNAGAGLHGRVLCMPLSRLTVGNRSAATNRVVTYSISEDRVQRAVQAANTKNLDPMSSGLMKNWPLPAYASNWGCAARVDASRIREVPRRRGL
jgi:hypothetical protein